MNRKVLISSSIVVVVVVLIVAVSRYQNFFAASSKDCTPATSLPCPLLSTAGENWKPYSDTYLGFSLEYPGNLVPERAFDQDRVAFFDAQKYSRIDINVVHAVVPDTDAWRDELRKSSPDAPDNHTMTSIGNEKALYIRDQQTIVLESIHHGRLYTIIFKGISEKDAARLQQSFKFIDSKS